MFRQLMTGYNQVVLTKIPIVAIGLLIVRPVVDVIFLLLGLVAILIAVFGKKFTVADGEGLEFKGKKPMPTWLGKLVFGVIGTAFVLYAVTALLSQSSQ